MQGKRRFPVTKPGTLAEQPGHNQAIQLSDYLDGFGLIDENKISYWHRFLSTIPKPFAVPRLTCRSTGREVSHDARDVLAAALRPRNALWTLSDWTAEFRLDVFASKLWWIGLVDFRAQEGLGLRKLAAVRFDTSADDRNKLWLRRTIARVEARSVSSNQVTRLDDRPVRLIADRPEIGRGDRQRGLRIVPLHCREGAKHSGKRAEQRVPADFWSRCHRGSQVLDAMFKLATFLRTQLTAENGFFVWLAGPKNITTRSGMSRSTARMKTCGSFSGVVIGSGAGMFCRSDRESD